MTDQGDTMRIRTHVDRWPLKGPDHGLGVDVNHSRRNEYRAGSLSINIDLWAISFIVVILGPPTAHEIWYEQVNEYVRTDPEYKAATDAMKDF